MQNFHELERFAIIAVSAMTLIPAAAHTAETVASAPARQVSSANIALIVPRSSEDNSPVIGTIRISNGSVFDLDNPAEDRALYRLANRAHMTTRRPVILQQLLFRPGDDFSAQALEESERILRANRYIQDVSIEPVPRGNGVVDVNVSTTDTWTLMPKISLSRSGGANNSALGVKEMNLFGTGVAVEASYKSDVDRDYRSLKISDRNLGSSWYGFTGVFANNSDGYTRSVQLARPFYSLHSTSALGFSLLDNDEVDSLYDRGSVRGQYRHEAKHYEFFGGWSKGLRNGWAKRYTVGLAVDDHRFTGISDPASASTPVPADRRFSYPFIGIELVQDKYEKASNYDQIDRTEDLFLGTRLNARLGLAASQGRAIGNVWLMQASAQTGFGSAETSALLLAANLDSRSQREGLANFLLSASASYYKRQSDHRLLYAALSATYGDNLDLDQYLLLGGDSGLRGYPLRYQSGDKLALLTVEQRFFTDWYPWRLFRVGAAVFLDVGRAWGDAPIARSDNRLLKNLGAGLRIGSSRSGLGRMTHIDIAVPLDGGSDIDSVQFLVSTKKSF